MAEVANKVLRSLRVEIFDFGIQVLKISIQIKHIQHSESAELGKKQN